MEKLDKIELPGQLISVLTDPLLQKYVELKPSPVVSARVNLWLAAYLEEQASAKSSSADESASLAEILHGLLRHARYTKVRTTTRRSYNLLTVAQELLSIVPVFLKEYLTSWNGNDHVDAILALLAFAPGNAFVDVYSDYISTAERATLSNGLSSYSRLVDFYTQMLHHRLAITSQRQPEHPQPSLSSPEQQFLRDLVSHFATLSTSLLLSLPSVMASEVVSSILTFWELLSASSQPHIVPILLPPMHLVYYLMQSSSADVVSRICGIIGTYKQAFDAHPRPVKHYYPGEVTDGLNWCLRDVYNLFWVARGLLVTEQKSLGMCCNPSLRTSLNSYLGGLDRMYAISHIFNLSHNAWLASMSSTAWRVLESQKIDRDGYDRNSIKSHTGPVSQQSLAALRDRGVSADWDGPNGYKVFVLNWLAERGLGGLRELMFATVTDLKNIQSSTS